MTPADGSNAPIEGLPAGTPRPFVLLDHLERYDSQTLEATRRFRGAPLWQGLEALAQAAALHQRISCDFSRHAFLLGFEECLFGPAGKGALDGLATVRVALSGQARGAASYAAALLFDDHPRLQASLSIGLVDYDARFDAAALSRRYRELFQCLTNPVFC